MTNPYWTPEELAGALKTTEAHIRTLCRTGRLAHRKVGKLIRIPDAAVRQHWPELYTVPAAAGSEA